MMATNFQGNRQPTLLLVEDDEMVRDGMARLFVREGYLVLTASTGHDAIGVLRTPEEPVDVVLLDIDLPDVSGLDLCMRIRQFFPQLPIVVCSGIVSPKEIGELRQLGVTHFFSKPIALSDLVATVRSFCKVLPLPHPI